MPRFPPAKIRVLSAIGGCAFSLLTLVATIVLFTAQSVTPVGGVLVVVIGASTLSLPLWAAGLLYSLYKGSLGLAKQTEQILDAIAIGILGLYIVGFVAVLSQTEPLRSIGDRMYALATILLVILSIMTLLGGFRRY